MTQSDKCAQREFAKRNVDFAQTEQIVEFRNYSFFCFVFVISLDNEVRN